MSALDYLGAVTADTRAKAACVMDAVTADWYHPTHFWGYDPNPGNPEHHSKTAVDFMVFGNTKAGDAIADYLWEHRTELGLKHLIWKQRIRSTVIQPGVWRPMADRGSPTNNHMDHVHAWFFDTPIKDTPARPPASSIPNVPKPTAPKGTVPKALTVDGDRGPATCRMLQAYLNYAIGAGLTVDGDFGPATKKALERWVGDSVNGSLSTAGVKALQRKVGMDPEDRDGDWGPNTTRALQTWLNNHRTLIRY